MSLEEVENIMDETADAVEYQRQISDLLGGSLSDEDEADVSCLIIKFSKFNIHGKKFINFFFGKYAQFKFDSYFSIIPVFAPLYLFHTFFMGFVFIGTFLHLSLLQLRI